MATGIFYLDEDREKDPSPISSPSHSPVPRLPDESPPISQSPGEPLPPRNFAGNEGSSQPLATTGPSVADQDVVSSTEQATSTSTTSSLSPPPSVTSPPPVSLQVPPSLTQQPAFGRKSGVFAATPSFPSPLAQAITVPSHSDTSSSSSHSSPYNSDDELALNTGSPRKRAESKGPSTGSPSDATTPSSSRRSSRPPSPGASRQAISPGTLLMSRARRSGSGSLLSGPSVNSPPRQRQEPKRSERGRDPLPSASTSGRGNIAEHNPTSPLAFGSPELEPAEPIVSPRPIPALSPSLSRERDANILGLGYWDLGTSPKAGGKGIDPIPSPSPRKEAALPVPMTKYVYTPGYQLTQVRASVDHPSFSDPPPWTFAGCLHRHCLWVAQMPLLLHSPPLPP